MTACQRNVPFLIDFEYESVLDTDVENISNQIPQDFPNHPDYVKYDIYEFTKKDFKLKQSIKVHDHLIIAIFDIHTNGCLTITPRSTVNDDTLILGYKFNASSCKEEEIYRLKYVLEKEESIKFIRFHHTLIELDTLKEIQT